MSFTNPLASNPFQLSPYGVNNPFLTAQINKNFQPYNRHSKPLNVLENQFAAGNKTGKAFETRNETGSLHPTVNGQAPHFGRGTIGNGETEGPFSFSNATMNGLNQDQFTPSRVKADHQTEVKERKGGLGRMLKWALGLLTLGYVVTHPKKAFRQFQGLVGGVIPNPF